MGRGGTFRGSTPLACVLGRAATGRERRSHLSDSKETKQTFYHVFAKSDRLLTMKVFRADFWEGDATKRFSVKKKGFSVKRGEAIQ